MKLREMCPACGGAHYSRQAAINEGNRTRYFNYSKLKYGGLLDAWMEELQPEIVRCDECGHCWYLRQPTAEQLSLMYARGRRLLPGTVLREPTREMVVKMQRLRKLSGKNSPRLLDFGSGFGRWARAASRAGFRVHAYEPSEVRSAKLAEEFTLVHNLAEIDGMRFDVVNLEQVLEHVPAPEETLRLLRTFFLPETILRVSVPNILKPPEGNRLWTDWPYDGKRVHAMAPFEHLQGFTPSSLNKLVERAGYRCLPFKMQWRYYPISWVRNQMQRFYPKAGQIMVLAKMASQ